MNKLFIFLFLLLPFSATCAAPASPKPDSKAEEVDRIQRELFASLGVNMPNNAAAADDARDGGEDAGDDAVHAHAVRIDQERKAAEADAERRAMRQDVERLQKQLQELEEVNAGLQEQVRKSSETPVQQAAHACPYKKRFWGVSAVLCAVLIGIIYYSSSEEPVSEPVYSLPVLPKSILDT